MNSSKIIWNLLPKGDKFGLYHNTYHLALKNIGEKYKIDYHFQGMNNMDELLNLSFGLPDNDSPIVFLAHHDSFDKTCSDKILSKCPKAKIIICGSDTVYYGMEEVTKLHVDLFIDTMESQIELLKKKVPVAYLYWTISEDIINYIKSTDNLIEKIYDGICLCNATPVRTEFFNNLSRKGCKVVYNIQSSDFEDIYQLYRQSKFTIGISSASPGFYNQGNRTMKGMRDWIGQYCNSLLIYDDYEDIVKIGSDTIPTFEYMNIDSCYNLMQELSENKSLYNEILQKQKIWLDEHTMEKQLEKILLENRFL